MLIQIPASADLSEMKLKSYQLLILFVLFISCGESVEINYYDTYYYPLKLHSTEFFEVEQIELTENIQKGFPDSLISTYWIKDSLVSMHESTGSTMNYTFYRYIKSSPESDWLDRGAFYIEVNQNQYFLNDTNGRKLIMDFPLYEGKSWLQRLSSDISESPVEVKVVNVADLTFSESFDSSINIGVSAEQLVVLTGNYIRDFKEEMVLERNRGVVLMYRHELQYTDLSRSNISTGIVEIYRRKSEGGVQ